MCIIFKEEKKMINNLSKYKRELKLKELEEQLEALKNARYGELTFKPEMDEEYYFFDVCNGMTKRVWRGSNLDIQILAHTEVFKTEEEANEEAKRAEYVLAYSRYLEERNSMHDLLTWDDENDYQVKYYAVAVYRSQADSKQVTISIYDADLSKAEGTHYALDPQFITTYVNIIGEDAFKKYILGVK